MLYDQFDIDRGDGVWISEVSAVNWRTRAKEQAIGSRPEFMVCPSSKAMPKTEMTQYQTWSEIPATGSYAFCGGHRGVNAYGCDACMVKHHNTGLHLYWTKVKLPKVIDGLSKTISVGEVIDGHLQNSSNMWTYVLRYADGYRVTEVALNTPTGVEAKMCGDNVGNFNGAFASEHPGGGQFLYADGRVEFMSEDIDLDTYQNLSTIAGTPLEMNSIDKPYCDKPGY